MAILESRFPKLPNGHLTYEEGYFLTMEKLSQMLQDYKKTYDPVMQGFEDTRIFLLKWINSQS